jgi:hypothetical protein
MAVPLISAVAPPRRLTADKPYGSESLRSWLKLRRIRAVIHRYDRLTRYSAELALVAAATEWA